MEYFCVFCRIELFGQKRKFCSNSCKCKFFHKNNPTKCNIWNKNRPKVKNRCLVCGKEYGRKKYCSNECKRFAYYFNDERYWKSLERMKSLKSKGNMNKKNFIIKNKSRELTRNMFHKKQINFPLKCNNCGSFLKLEIHHEIYPQTRGEIKEAVKNKKIILLCKFCHENL